MRLIGGALCALSVALVMVPGYPHHGARALAQDTPAIAVVMGGASRVSNIDSGLLRSAFLNLPVTSQGERLLAFNLGLNSPLRARFEREVLGFTPHQVGLYWIDQRVRDGRRPPRSVPTAELAIRVVSSLKGAISYVPLAVATGAQVRVLRIDGKAPGDPGYLLK